MTPSLERFRFINVPLTDQISRLQREMEIRIGAPDIVFMRDTIYGGPYCQTLITDNLLPLNAKLTWCEWGANKSDFLTLCCLTLEEYFEMLSTLDWTRAKTASHSRQRHNKGSRRR